jgi:hypothetical protein
LEASITEKVVAATHFLKHRSADTEVKAPTAALIYPRAGAARCAVVGVDSGLPDRALARL